MQLVLLAAGFGTRFGGLKQLAPVGPNGEAIMDYTASFAHACGFTGAVVVIRDEIEADMRAHIKKYWPAEFPVEFVYQPSVRGTAPAVLAAAKFVTGPFAVANADDLYGDEALQLFPEHFAQESVGPDARHLLVAYHLENTVLASSHVKRGLCELNENGELRRIGEHEVTVSETGTFEAIPFQHSRPSDAPLPEPIALDGSELVSMNLWGFHERIFKHLDLALSEHLAAGYADDELLLPEVIEHLVTSNTETVRVVVTEASCIGITNRDDLALVREQVSSSDIDDLSTVTSQDR